MRYRNLGKSDIKVSEIGLGCEHLQGQDYDTINSVVTCAIEQGINIFDIFMSEPEVRTNIGKALVGRRDKVILQGHIGAGWIDGQYCRTRDVEQCKFFFEDFMSRLQTDYVDIGMLHYVDTEEDYNHVFNTAITDYAKQLKSDGIIKLIGISTHDPVTATKAAQSGFIDVIMFSVNPAYDLLPEDTLIDDLFESQTYKSDFTGTNQVRENLYKICEANGVAITVMKGLGAGILLNKDASPFGVALTPYQCINYSLTRPSVASVLVGARTTDEVIHNVGFAHASDLEKDYSVILASTSKYSMKGRCMYCNHCLPCPSRIDIAKVNKLLDLALINDKDNDNYNDTNTIPDTVRGHYNALEYTAQDCIACGSCEENCPFGVKVIDKMELAKNTFGK